MMLRRVDGISEAPDRFPHEMCRRTPRIPHHGVRAASRLCRELWAGVEKGCFGFVDARQTEQPCRARPSEVKANTTSVCTCIACCLPEPPQSALSRELSSSASFQFLLLFFAFSPESESLRESCFRFLWLEVLLSFSSPLLSSELLSSALWLSFAYLWFLHGLFFFFLLCLPFEAQVSSLLLELSAFLRFSPSDFFFFFFFFFRQDFFDRFGEPASDLDFFVLWRLVFAVGLSSLGK